MARIHPLVRIEVVTLVAIGGFVGANSRYAVSLLVPGLTGTFIVNVTGSFVLGFIIYEALYTGFLSEKGRIVLTTGFLSSFTTYSMFAFETLDVSPLVGLANVGASYTFGFAGVLAGRWLASRIQGGQDD